MMMMMNAMMIVSRSLFLLPFQFQFLLPRCVFIVGKTQENYRYLPLWRCAAERNNKI